jgi:hypothetical protein
MLNLSGLELLLEPEELLLELLLGGGGQPQLFFGSLATGLL